MLRIPVNSTPLRVGQCWLYRGSLGVRRIIMAVEGGQAYWRYAVSRTVVGCPLAPLVQYLRTHYVLEHCPVRDLRDASQVLYPLPGGEVL